MGILGLMLSNGTACPKCGCHSGDNWRQCKGNCPIEVSPHFNPITESIYRSLENGHHSKSKEIYSFIAELDFRHGGDLFGFKSGGDGDNGEHLMNLLDCYFFFQETGENDMEKLGVKIEEEAAKKAEQEGTCPVCGDHLISRKPPKCERCGTRPFESSGVTTGRFSVKEPVKSTLPRTNDE